ncbi:DENN domain-containing protein 2B-like [Diadema antillarum]|uniref:DENN domain-containing protein 2B-like n=1 Tax=Diadema antillarum TaxID=105358 RepID=UPI003A87C8FB
MDSLVQEFETVASELTQTNVKENQEEEIAAPDKPERTFAQDIYDQSKLKPDGQINFDSIRRKRSMKRVSRPRATYEDRNTILFLKETLSNGHPTAADEAHKKQRSQSAKVTSDRAEYEQVAEGFVPGSSCSRNCNHNGEMEREKIDRTAFGFDQGTEFFPSSPKDYHDTVVVENNNRSSFLDVLKSPVSRRPKLPTPPPPPMHTALPSSLVDAKSDAAPRFPSPQTKGVIPVALPSDTSKFNGISSGNTSNHQLNLGVHTTQDRVEYMSPESPRRMTDSALIQSLSPRSVRRKGHPKKDYSPAQAEYAEPITIKRSLSDESLETLRRQSPVLDNQGYSVPGSHLLVPSKANTLRPKMRRKINDAFRRKHHHQKTEDDRISVTSEGSDTEVNEQVLKKRLTQVRAMRLRSSVYCTMQPRLTSQYSKLYEYAVIVSLQMNEETRRYEPYEMRRFPYEVSDSQTDKLRAIPQFCFPDAFKWAPVDQYNSESFCFVLTSSDGSRLYGYNRRFLPPGDGPRLPEVVCVMSPIGCYPIYNQLLDEIENRRKSSMTAVENLLKLCNEAPFPRPGSHTKVTTPAPQTRRRNHFTLHNYEHKPLILQRPQDQRLEHVDFDTLFNCLSVNRIVQIFASLLLERRVIMCSGKLSKLSRCSQALVGLLYPFSWQHVYVPVLPEKLIDMCCSPTPYIMGMLSLCIPRLEEMPLEEVLIVDLDSRDFYTMVGDEETILPKKLTLALERALKVCSMSSWEGADTDDELSEDHEAKNSAISEAFIRFFVETVGHYSNHFTQQFDGEQKFDREGFVKAVSSKSVRNFLEVFSETQMFSLFIQEKETESEGISQGLFERRVREFENELKSNSKNISAKMKKFGKAVKEIKDSGLKLAESAKGVKMRMKHNLDDRI